jgi:O-antigen/teichoic acid export membrane protein
VTPPTATNFDAVPEPSTAGGAPVLARLRQWAPSGLLALLDQGLISGANFMTGIFLARRAGPESYGAYMLLFAAFLLIANAHQALLLEPANVLAFSLFPGRNDRYLRVVLRLHGIFTAAFLALGGVALWLALRLGMKVLLVNALSGMVIAVPCVLLFWLARSFAYLEFAPGAAVRGSAVYGGVLLVSILGVARLRGLTPESVFCCAAVASLAAGLRLLLPHMPRSHGDAGEPGLRHVWPRHWNFGRWGLGTVGLSWAQTNSISFISGSLLGLRDVGGLNALVALLLPMLQVLTSATRLALPRIAQIHTFRGVEATRRPVIQVALVLLTLTAAYALVIAMLRVTIFHYLYGERFMAYAWMVPLMGLHLVACAGLAACDIGFNSIQAPHASFPTKLLMVVCMIPVNTALTWKFGLLGAAIGVPVFSSLTAILLALKLRSVWNCQRSYAAAGHARPANPLEDAC